MFELWLVECNKLCENDGGFLFFYFVVREFGRETLMTLMINLKADGNKE